MSKENIVMKKKIKQGEKLEVYDIYDRRVLNSLQEKDALRKEGTKYANKKILTFENQNFDFFRVLIRHAIQREDLFGENNEINIEYLTLEGWKGDPNLFQRMNFKQLMAIPQTDRNVRSGDANNALDPKEPILMARVNVMNWDGP